MGSEPFRQGTGSEPERQRGCIAPLAGARAPTYSLHTVPASDGYRLYYRRFDPPGPPKGRLVFVHGIRSHGGWYGRSCATFAAGGYEVYFLDRRGAGLHTARRGDAPGFRRLLDDTADFLLHLRRERAFLPTFLAGISWGGKLAVALPYRRPGLVDGLILVAPGLKPQVKPSPAERARIAFARLFRPTKRFPIPLNDPDLFTASPEWQRFIDTDRFGLREATARFLFASFGLDVYLRRAARRVTVPVLLLLAGHDRVIDNTKTRGYAAKFRAVTTILDYPGAHHTLEFEPDGHPWVSDTLRWLEKRLR